MADVTKTIQVIFGATDNLSGVVQIIGQSINGMADGLDKVVSPLNAVADAVKFADAAIVGLGVAFAGAALQKAGEFSTAIEGIGILFDGTTKQVQTFGDNVLTFAGNSTQSLKSITDSLSLAVGSGIEWGKSIEFVSNAEKLAVAGSGDLKSATDVLVSSLNAYGASAGDAAKYSDILMQTVLVGKTTLPELAHSLSEVTSTAAAAKIPFADLNAAVAALTAGGVPTSQAMTTIKAAISNIITPSKEAEDQAKLLKIQFDANALAAKGFDGVLNDVYKATGGNITQIATLFGSMEALKGVTLLGADASGIYKKALEEIRNSAGSTEEAYKKMAATWDASTQAMKNSIELLLVAAGRALNDDGEFSQLLQNVRKLFSTTTFEINAGAFDSVFNTFASLTDKISQYLSKIADALPAALDRVDWTRFNASMVNLAQSIGGIFSNIDLTTPEGLSRAIQLVIDSFATLLNMGAGIAQKWGEVWSAAMPLVEAFASMNSESAEAAGRLLGVGDVLDKLLPGVRAFGDTVEALGLGVKILAGTHIVDLLIKLNNLATLIPGVAAAAAGLGTALGVGGMVTAAGAAGYAIGTVLSDGIDYVVRKLTGSGSLGELIYDVTHRSQDLEKQTTPTAESLKKIGDSALLYVKPAFIELDDKFQTTSRSASDLERMNRLLETSMFQAAAAAGEAKLKTELLAAAQKAAKEPTLENKQAFYDLVGLYKDTATQSGHLAEATKVIKDQITLVNPPVQDVNRNLTTTKGVMAELQTKTNLTNKELIDLAKFTKDAEIKLEQIASNERIKLIESKIKLDIAELEANTKTAIAILDNLSKTYEADTGLIGELTSQITNGYSTADQFRMRLAEDANTRVKELHEAQMAVIKAQVQYLSARTATLNSGAPLVTVQADGLQSHLEAMMWEIFKAIQVKMAYDGGDALVGGL